MKDKCMQASNLILSLDTIRFRWLINYLDCGHYVSSIYQLNGFCPTFNNLGEELPSNGLKKTSFKFTLQNDTISDSMHFLKGSSESLHIQQGMYNDF